MNDSERPKLPHPEPVTFLPTPPEPERAAVMSERRRYAKILAEAALENRNMYEAAYTDPLTRLGNRRMYDKEFPKLFEFAKKKGISIALAYGDVRGLKRTNDHDGHGKGDQLLRAAAEALTNIAREGDMVIHMSGDEFAIVMLGYSPLEGQSQEGLDQETANRLTNRFAVSAKEHGIPEERHVGFDLSLTTTPDHD